MIAGRAHLRNRHRRAPGRCDRARQRKHQCPRSTRGGGKRRAGIKQYQKMAERLVILRGSEDMTRCTKKSKALREVNQIASAESDILDRKDL